ncbi:BTB/POZ domain-containing protein 6-A [Habropoda laboriosa]|uniref:BTB/POZ domain-containing protein 6-A n=1 Tax=Habropoda laboriosa TaxID=597456 RepID=A0A0L7R0W7_9HYME|nr:BTB/POZ domain-containing protein 6-A [Habropoda laboriosa]
MKNFRLFFTTQDTGSIEFLVCFVADDGTRCARPESERLRQKIREGVRSRICSKTFILPVIARHSSKEIAILRKPKEDMPSTNPSTFNHVIFEVGPPGNTWKYCVERERLAERSEWFRAMLVGPLAPAPSDPPPLLKLQHVEKRAFDNLLRYFLDEPVNFQSVPTARDTLDVAHQYLCSELARLAVEYLERNLNTQNVLEIYEGLGLYANHETPDLNRSSNSPTAPPAPGDDAGEIAVLCTRLLSACLHKIDVESDTVFGQQHFEELNSVEVEELASRDTLKLTDESILFNALDRWAAAECRRNGIEPSASNKRSALSNDVWYSVRYPLMTDRKFIEGPMASGILTSEESALIVARILGHVEDLEGEEVKNLLLPKLNSTPRVTAVTYEDLCYTMSKPGTKECQDNRKNRRKECVTQGHRTCTKIGTCMVRVLAWIFD